MRVIAGKYRGRVLKSPPDLKTRPTSDRLRETLFNILMPQTPGARFLDLCAGTGAIGIEALSRGASFAVFVDKSRKMCTLIESNLDVLAIPEDQTEVVMSDAENFSRRHRSEPLGWDIVYYDPPYDTIYRDVLEHYGAPDGRLLNAGGILVAEHHLKIVIPDEVGEMRRWRQVKQGESCLSFFERA
jgi:16S rRNA (guanine(966)-N(2))-methyltransferase RsmD